MAHFRSFGIIRAPKLFSCIAVFVFLIYVLFNNIRFDAIFVNVATIFYIFNPKIVSRLLFEVGLIAWITLLALGLGHSVVRACCVPEHIRNNGLLTIPVGLGILGFILFPLIYLHLLSPVVIVILLVTLSVTLAIKYLYRIALPGNWRAFVHIPALRDNWMFIIPLGFAGFIALCSGLMPPTQSDALRYHLTVPWQYLQQGGYVEFPHFSFASFPFLIDYLFIYPFALGSISGPKLIHVLFYFLSTGLVGTITASLAGRNAAGWAMLVFASTPFSPIFASWGFIEFGLTTYTLLTFWLAICTRSEWRRGNHAMALRMGAITGIACGMMLGCKYTALASLGFAGLIILWPREWNMQGFFAGWPAAALMGAIASLLASPWYIKNWLLYENPVYPFGRSLFPTPGWSEFNQLFFTYHAGLKGNLTAIKQSPLLTQLIDWVTLPFRIVLYPGEPWHPVDFGGWPMGPLWLVLAIVMLIFLRLRWKMAALGAGALFLFVVWGMTYRDIRFLLPAMGLLAPLLGIMAYGVIREAPWTRWMLLFLVVMNLIQTFALTFLPFNYMPWMVVGGVISEKEYLSEYSVDTRVQNQGFAWLEENTTPDQRVLIHGFETHFYCPNDYIGADWFNTDPLLAWSWEAQSVDDLVVRMQEEGIEFIVYDFGNVREYFPFYRLFRLTPELGTPLLQSLIDNEGMRVRYPFLYREFQMEYSARLTQAEAQSPQIEWLNELLHGDTLEEVFRWDDPMNESAGISVLRVPPRVE